jgi:hypothetical protein
VTSRSKGGGLEMLRPYKLGGAIFTCIYSGKLSVESKLLR